MCDNAEKSKISSKTGHFTVFTAYFIYFGPRGLQLPLTGHKTLETGNVSVVRCRKFFSVTVTGHLCRSVELVQRVTVTGVCRFERNGTVLYNFDRFVSHVSQGVPDVPKYGR